MRIYLLLFLINLSLVQQYDCRDEIVIKDDYFIDGDCIIKGYELGSQQLYLDFSYNKQLNKLIIKVSEINNKNDTLPVKYANCCIAKYKDETRYKRKKILASSDSNGMIYLDKDKDFDFLSLDYPGYKVKLIRYKKLIACLDSNNK